MTNVELFCTGGEHRGEKLVAYLYEDLAANDRVEMETHLAACAACRTELAALSDVRGDLAQWAPPEPAFGSLVPRTAALPRRGAFAALAEIPLWAQTAAALLCVGVAAGFANLEMRYGTEGLTVRTGWSSGLGQAGQARQAGQAGQVETSTPASDAANGRPSSVEATASPRPWEADLAALETSLRAELVSNAASATNPGQLRTAAPDSGGAELSSVRTLIDESEERQRRELALRLADMLRDVQYQRRDDLEKIDRSLGLIQANLGVMQNTGVEVMRQRQMINDLAVRVSQR